jgi:Cu/Ag efflux protein CusF
MHGKILSLNASDKSARIDAGPIGDWMGAMTMNYPVKDDAEFAKLTAGATIDATVFVDGDNFWVGEVKPAQ